MIRTVQDNMQTIRAMNSDELADFLSRWQVAGAVALSKGKVNGQLYSKDEIKEWLFMESYKLKKESKGE